MKIPPQFKRAVDELKNDVIARVFEQASILKGEMINFKSNCFDEINTYMELLANEYNAPSKGKGNLSLTNTDGTKKIVINVNHQIQFDEKLKIAKNLIDKCIAKWIDSSRDEIKALVNFSFEVNKEGKVSIGRVLSLRRVVINDVDWQNAIQAITDSLMVVDSKSYIRFYHRKDEYSAWKHLSLELAALDLTNE